MNRNQGGSFYTVKVTFPGGIFPKVDTSARTAWTPQSLAQLLEKSRSCASVFVM